MLARKIKSFYNLWSKSKAAIRSDYKPLWGPSYVRASAPPPCTGPRGKLNEIGAYTEAGRGGHLANVHWLVQALTRESPKTQSWAYGRNQQNHG